MYQLADLNEIWRFDFDIGFLGRFFVFERMVQLLDSAFITPPYVSGHSSHPTREAIAIPRARARWPSPGSGALIESASVR